MKRAREQKAVRSLLPLHPVRVLCSLQHWREQVLTEHRGQQYADRAVRQMEHIGSDKDSDDCDGDIGEDCGLESMVRRSAREDAMNGNDDAVSILVSFDVFLF